MQGGKSMSLFLFMTKQVESKNNELYKEYEAYLYIEELEKGYLQI